MSAPIYQPSDDSLLFAEYLRSYLERCSSGISFLDLGTGSGILAKTALEFLPARNIVASDINPEAISALQNQPFKAVCSDLFDNISGSFDFIVCNAPYLPFDVREPKDSQLATTGGVRGDEFALKFLQQAKKFLSPGGVILLLVSSLTPMNKINAFNPQIVARKKLSFEELFILKIV